MNIWKNQFHKTIAKSTLSQTDIENIYKRMQGGYINSKHKDARKLKRLYDKLCPHKLDDCSCLFMMYQD